MKFQLRILTCKIKPTHWTSGCVGNKNDKFKVQKKRTSGMTFCIFPVKARCALLSSTKFSSKRWDICRVFSAWSVSLLRSSVKSLNNKIAEATKPPKCVSFSLAPCYATARKYISYQCDTEHQSILDSFHSVIANWWRSEVKLAEVHISSFCPANYSFHLSIQFSQFLIAWLLSVLQHVLGGKVFRIWTKTNL